MNAVTLGISVGITQMIQPKPLFPSKYIANMQSKRIERVDTLTMKLELSALGPKSFLCPAILAAPKELVYFPHSTLNPHTPSALHIT
jgi:hypothetical protein